MYRLSAVLLAAFLFPASALAADVPTGQGTKALLFQFQGLSHVAATGYKGGIGMRFFTGDQWALVPRVILGVATTERESEDVPTRETRLTSLGIHLDAERHWGRGSVVPYWGFGGGFDYRYARNEQQVIVRSDAGQARQTDSATTVYALGVSGALGFEWGFAKSLTLGAEYRLGVFRTWGDTQLTYPGPDDRESSFVMDESGWALGLDTFSISLGVYLP